MVQLHHLITCEGSPPGKPETSVHHLPKDAETAYHRNRYWAIDEALQVGLN